MLRRINPILPELIGNIVLFGAAAQLIGIWFPEDKLGYSLGLWLGIALAIGTSIHMSVMILDAVDMGSEKRAKVKTTVFSILRYLVIAALCGLVAYFHIANVLAMLLGVLGLKVAALLYPVTNKFLERR